MAWSAKQAAGDKGEGGYMYEAVAEAEAKPKPESDEPKEEM